MEVGPPSINKLTMSHHKYQTQGFILGGFNIGESNRFLYIFTKELGLVGASAQGVREMKSKLRYSLQNFSYSNVDLVRGKHVWRITNAENIYTLADFTNSFEKQKVFINIAIFIKRFFVGEGFQSGLFDEIIGGFNFLKYNELTIDELKSLEAIMVLKILKHLGYFEVNEKFNLFLKINNWNKEVLKQMSVVRPEVIFGINRAIDCTHL